MGKQDFASVDLSFAQNVLGYAGDTNLGVKPTPRVASLIHTIRCCVVEGSPAAKDYLAGLRREFPEYVRLVEIVVSGPHQLDVESLRQFVKTRDGAQLEIVGRAA